MCLEKFHWSSAAQSSILGTILFPVQTLFVIVIQLICLQLGENYLCDGTNWMFSCFFLSPRKQIYQSNTIKKHDSLP